MKPRWDAALRATSRSFYLTLRVLPGAVRPQIALAYLLARTADTVADTRLVPPERRLAALQQFRARLRGDSDAPLDFGDLARQQGTAAERDLLEQCEASLAALTDLAPDNARRVRTVLDIITSGQELDLRRFADACAEHIVAVHSDADLDDYTYRVAGCVGAFWTELCRAHLFPRANLDQARLMADAVRFGKGLQLVNILRDLPADLRLGRCYMPAERLAELGLRPADLLQPVNEPKFRPLYDSYLDLALAHLAAGWAYTNALPRRQVRVRLACAWPVLLGVRTLARLRTAHVLDQPRPIKVTRAEVRHIILRSLALYPFRGAWENQFNRWSGRRPAGSPTR